MSYFTDINLNFEGLGLIKVPAHAPTAQLTK